MDKRAQAVAQILLKNRGGEDRDFWGWLKPNQPASMRDANKFLLASILDYQIPAETAWGNARRLADHILGDPDKLWHKITSITLSEWVSKRKEYSLHRFPKGHERVWTIGRRIVQQYDGDARKIWDNQSIDATLYRLNDLGVGEQISRMVVGALIDTGQIEGKGDVKVDIHVRRVLGRAVQGREFPLQETGRVIDLTREMHPDNPWLLDRPLYLLGKRTCQAKEPKCTSCDLRVECAYYSKQ